MLAPPQHFEQTLMYYIIVIVVIPVISAAHKFIDIISSYDPHTMWWHNRQIYTLRP